MAHNPLTCESFVTTELLDQAPLGALFLAAIALLGFAMEGGYRFGRWRHRRAAEERESPVGAMVGSILGLLALVLAFTFNLAATRFDLRRQVVLEESNAVGTAFLRAQFLPEPQRSAIRDLLREYVEVRLRGVEQGQTTAAVARSEELHALLWTQTTAAVADSPDSILAGLFVESLNHLIDIHAKRILIGLRNRIPIVIWGILSGLAVLGMFSVGYQAGIAATLRSPAMFGLVLAFVFVLYLILDLDRATQGLFQVSQESMHHLQESLHDHP